MQPWIQRPYILINWWEMEKFTAAAFYGIGQYLCEVRRNFEALDKSKASAAEPGAHAAGQGGKNLRHVQNECREIGLVISAKCIDFYFDRDQVGITLAEVIEILNQLERTIRWEMEEKLFMFVPPERASRYEIKEAFGAKVAKQFRPASFDIEEAGNCYAAARWTACVFHLMRVLELGLSAFAKEFSVPSDHTNWHNIIEGIESKVRNMGNDPAKAADWKEKQERYSQAANGFMFFKDAWRNYTAHARGKYIDEEADSIYRNVRVFMQRLADMGLSVVS
jgi:hypothetical protein